MVPLNTPLVKCVLHFFPEVPGSIFIFCVRPLLWEILSRRLRMFISWRRYIHLV